MSDKTPAFKLIPGTGFLVDGFKFASPSVRAYFLSHAHSDHYTGITESWSSGTIYCSEVTGRLIVHLLGLKPEYVHALPLDVPVDIQGVEVTLVDANHCPGAVQFVFRLPCGRRFLHCGDMRFSPDLLSNPHLRRAQGATAVFLDTTYCNPRFTFPPQEESVEYIAATLMDLLQDTEKRRLFLISTYVIGKERVLLEVHKRSGMRIHVSEKKLGALECIELPGAAISDVFTTDPSQSCIHVTQWGFLGDSWPYFRPNFVNMEQARAEAGVDEVVGFVPTGWMYEMKRRTYPVREKGPCKIHLVPYSEHSSYNELREYVRFLRPAQVIPTVGVNNDDNGKNAASQLKHFRNLVDETASKAKFLAGFHRSESALLSGKGQEARKQSAASSSSLAAADSEALQCESAGAEGNGLAEDGPCASSGGSAENEQAVQDDIDGASASTMLGGDAAISRVTLPRNIQEQSLPDSTDHETDATAACASKPGDSPRDDLAISDEPTPDQTADDMDQDTAADLRTIASPRSIKASAEAGPSPIAQLIGILGEDVSQAQASRLLFEANGDVARAVNEFYEPGASPRVASDTPSSRKQATSLVPASTKRKAASTVRALPASKKAKAQSKAGQKQITTFFGAGATKVLAQQGARASGTAQLSSVMQQQAQALPQSAQGAGHPTSSCSLKPPLPVEDGAADTRPRQLYADAGGAAMIKQDPHAGADESEAHAAGQEAADSALAELASDAAGAALPTASKPGRHSISLPPVPFSGKPSASVKPSAEELHKGSGKPQQAAAAELQGVRPARSPSPSAHATPPASPARKTPSLDPGAGARLPQGQPHVMDVTAAATNDTTGPPDAVLKSITGYDPVSMACWARGAPTPYLHIARALAAMDSTTKRLRIGDALTNMFRSVIELCPEDLLPSAYLVSGRLAPDYENLELKVGGATVGGAITEATGVTRAKLRDMFNRLGDLGDVAQACRHKQTTLAKPAPLTVRGVYGTLRRIASETGSGAAGRRQRAVMSLLRSCRERETQYLVRTLVQNLRVGAGWRSVVPALARASVLAREGATASKARLEQGAAAAAAAFHLCPSLEVLVPALLEEGVDALARRCTLTPGVPLKPMLAKICEGIPDALRQLGTSAFLAEHKYDGQRAQIHLLASGEVRVFSRNCEDRSPSFPDVAEAVRAAASGGAKALVMDTELVAVDRAQGNRLKAFQELSTRARGQITSHEVTVAVCVFVFDILYVDGSPLVHLPLRDRRARLQAALPNLSAGHVQIAHSIELCLSAASIPAADGPQGTLQGRGAPTLQPQPDKTSAEAVAQETASTEEAEEAANEEGAAVAARVQDALLEAFAAGTEGLMLKGLDGPGSGYQPSRRSESWLKLKRDYCEGLRDSLDLVPIGAWHGNGRKVGWLSPFLLAAWDPSAEQFQSVCRCMSGFTDAFYQEATARLKGRQIPGPKPYYCTGERPDMWFEPQEVWEIRGADLTISPVHMSAVGHLHPTRGVSLRFPRFIRIREDKRAEDATGPDVICELYNKQTRKAAPLGQQNAPLAADPRTKHSADAEHEALGGGSEGVVDDGQSSSGDEDIGDQGGAADDDL